MIKKLLIMALCTSLSVSFCACSEISLEQSTDVGSVDGSVVEDRSDVDSKAESAEAELSEDASEDASNPIIDNSSTDVSDIIIDNSSTDVSDIIIDNSSTDIPSEKITTDKYTYSVSLSEEERSAINSGSNGEFLILVNKSKKGIFMITKKIKIETGHAILDINSTTFSVKN